MGRFWDGEKMCVSCMGMRSSFNRVVGDGRGVLFWEDRWIKSVRLMDKFHRLYRLSSRSVCNMGSWGNEGWV